MPEGKESIFRRKRKKEKEEECQRERNQSLEERERTIQEIEGQETQHYKSQGKTEYPKGLTRKTKCWNKIRDYEVSSKGSGSNS